MSNQPDDGLEALDRELLNAVQWDFPLEAAPVRGARRAARDLAKPRCAPASRRSKDAGVLRQLSAIFDTRALGYSSALVAAKVDPDHIDEAAAVISEHPGVSHNYKRNHAYNLWYTLAVPPGDVLDEHIDVLHRESGSLVTRKLPTLKLYKIGVKLDMTGKTAANAKAEVLEHERPERKAEMPAPDLSDLELATIRIVQDDLAERRAPVRGACGEQLGVERVERVLDDPAIVQGPQAHAPLRGGDEPPQRRVQGERDGRVGGSRRPARRDRAADGELRGREPLLPPPDLRRLAVQRVHDGARPQRARLRSDDRGDPRRDRRRRVLPAVVDQGVQEGAAALLHARVGPSGTRRAPHRARLPRPSTRRRSAPRPRRRSRPPGPGDDAPRSRRPRRAAARPASRARRSDRLLVGVQRLPTRARRRSLATTHGCTRYGTSAGGASPRPLDQSACSTRRASSSGSAGRTGAAETAARPSSASQPSAATL